MKYEVIQELIGKTFNRVFINSNKDELYFYNLDEGYRFYHSQDCCESVSIEDICGELDDLIGSPLLVAEVASKAGDMYDTLWTFYKFSTMKGSVTIRWLGVSDCYSVEVELEQMYSHILP